MFENISSNHTVSPTAYQLSAYRIISNKRACARIFQVFQISENFGLTLPIFRQFFQLNTELVELVGAKKG